MIKIEIIDPHTIEEKVLIETASYLMRLAGHEIVIGNLVQKESKVLPSRYSPPTPPTPPVAPVDHLPEFKNALLPSPPVSSATEVPAPPTASGSLFDADGTPWDHRIHTRTKSKNSDGTWKLARGVNLDLVHKVRAELRQVMAIPTPEPSSPPLPIPPPPVTSLAPPLVTPQMNFPALVTKITSAVAEQKLEMKSVLDMITKLGIPSVPLIATRPDLIPEISANLDLLMGN